jgi:heme/copper-type cytochrome/quinol oxidase subunit 2
MNTEKGFKRLTFVLSVLCGVVLMAWGVAEAEERLIDYLLLPVVFLFGFAGVWLLYFVVRYIVKGFAEKHK